MRIGVNAAGLAGDRPADTGNISTALLKELCRLHPEHQFIFFVDRPGVSLEEFTDNVQLVEVPLKGHKAWQLYWWREWQFPAAIKKQQLDLYLGFDGQLPLRSKVPARLLITDTGFLHGVAGMSKDLQRYLRKNTLKYLQAAQKVLVISPVVQEDLLTYAPTVAEKLVLLPPGLDSSYHPVEWEEREQIKQEFTGGMEYFVAVGSMHPRNNILPLLKAFSALKRRLRSNMKLILAGASTNAGAEIIENMATYKFRNDVIWLQDASQETLARVVAGAYTLVYTSRFEGLALPVYAALKCEVPVVAMEGAAARVAGAEGVLYTDPDSLEDLAEKMSVLYKDEVLRSRMLERGRQVTLPGGWTAAASQILE
ncbi:glycosyltransferase [Chitinophaga sancti]|uniref:Glycosyltransferase n=1 Tax=Chitinophaga sancti TaxID=1004 RepID=A0A1K1RIX0_9BACT|nr:glycosyltransferase [Chitinophaga sancti]WQD60719.1 glycosyltransferase [Chitinophaga sancti]WQG87153.1 glycosyltransferase [Chitinophaga sancti]SFW72119.1 Glycosyltransferase involved in cell wall bisynthesis [Chitinophaga sancti]